jgi:hypothetical protein
MGSPADFEKTTGRSIRDWMAEDTTHDTTCINTGSYLLI